MTNTNNGIISDDIFTEDSISQNSIIDHVKIKSYDGDHLGDAFINKAGHICVQFKNGVALTDTESIIPKVVLEKYHCVMESDIAIELFDREILNNWILSRLLFLSVKLKNCADSYDLYEEFRDGIHDTSKEIFALLAGGLFSDKEVISTEIVEKSPSEFIGDLLDSKKGLYANLHVTQNSWNRVGYLSWFRGYYFQVSSTRDGEGCMAHSCRVYPNLDLITNRLITLSPILTKEYLRANVIHCLSELDFSWGDLKNGNDKINNYCDFLINQIISRNDMFLSDERSQEIVSSISENSNKFHFHLI